MIGRGLRILLTTLCCLLALATSASADCAWVLWIQSVGLSAPSREWVVQAALQTHSDCSKKLDEREALARKQGDWSAIERNAPTDLFLSAGMSITSWKCLPDTVDPRGPKGKRG